MHFNYRTRAIKGRADYSKNFFGNLVRLIIKSGYNSKNIFFWTLRPTLLGYRVYVCHLIASSQDAIK